MKVFRKGMRRSFLEALVTARTCVEFWHSLAEHDPQMASWLQLQLHSRRDWELAPLPANAPRALKSIVAVTHFLCKRGLLTRLSDLEDSSDQSVLATGKLCLTCLRRWYSQDAKKRCSCSRPT